MMREMFSEDICDGKMAEVHMDETGAYWYGITILRSPKDWTFSPHAQFGHVELAIAAARALAKGIRFDEAH